MTENDTTTEAPPGRRDLPLFEIVLGGGVLLISLISLFVAVSANRTQERMLSASVWPSLTYAASNAGADGSPQISLDLFNRGVGPARVRWAELRYEDAPVRDSHALLELCCGAPADGELTVSVSTIQHRVIGAGEWIRMLRVPQPEGSTAVYDALWQARGKIRQRLCYCSVLDDCWLLDSDSNDPEAVKQCPAPPAVLWGG